MLDRWTVSQQNDSGTAVSRQPISTRLAYVLIALFCTLFVVLGVRDNALAETLGYAHADVTMLGVNHETETIENAETTSSIKSEFVHPVKLRPVPASEVSSSTLWLARGIYSETKRPEEQELVAWTIRNRVETGYRGATSYRDAVLDPYQYSAFIPGTRTRRHYTSLTSNSQAKGWQKAISIANWVASAPPELRPFSQTTRHFFSERSMVGGRHPNWAIGHTPVQFDRPYQISERRFRFYEDIA